MATQKEVKLRYFSGELAKHPLNILAFFRLSILANVGMMLIRDYLYITHFKNARLIEREKEANDRAVKVDPYKF